MTLIKDFEESYLKTPIVKPEQQKQLKQLFDQLKVFIKQQVEQPYSFQVFHQSIREPFDFYQFGLDFIRPLIDFSYSKVIGLEQFQQIRHQLDHKENVILLANHQIEPDPQIISLLLEPFDATLASQMIFVAGHRVVTDPMAIPLSLGRNLLCIYSKKHIQYPPEDKEKKIAHNQRTLKKMGELLNEGGYCIYVAPSGGRDRRNALGQVDVSPFDAQSIELFWLIAQQAKQPTHFYPLSLSTYPLMPPPDQVEKDLGEKREVHFTSVYLACGSELDMEHFPGSETLDKHEKRAKRAEYIHALVQEAYTNFHC
jgi:glycerol-3-phosphate O-acyltransferase